MPTSQVTPSTKAAKVRAITDGILDLPSLPMVVSKIVELVDNPKTNAATLSSLIATDPGLTARMLKLANSAFYGFPRRIGTINLAIVVLGFNTVKDLGVSSSLVDRFNISHEISGFDMTGFWEHSIGTAIAARMISRVGSYRVIGEAFVTGLLHDIGKAIDRETEGTHTQIGADFMRRFKESEEVVNAIESHHGDVPMVGPYPVLVQAADAISGSRPGARRETLEGYVKRLEKLEQLAESFSGVVKTYAIQAGREVRVMVEYEQIDDALAEQLASDIAQKIQAEMEYPGQIKVTVIREYRAIDYAK